MNAGYRDLFADRLTQRLARDVPRGTRLLVARLDRVGEAVAAAAERILFVGYWRESIFVGPVWRPHRPGCPRCLVIRSAGPPDGPELDGDSVRLASGGDRLGSGMPPGTIGLTAVLGSALLRSQAGADDPRVHVIDVNRRTIGVELLVPEPTCPQCGRPPGSTLPRFAPAGLTLREQAAGSARARGLGELSELAERRYLGARIGFARSVRRDLQSPFGASSFDLTSRWGRREPVIGRAMSYRKARTVAVLEGLERYCGLFGGRRREVVRACYDAVRDRAIDPRELGLHPALSYARSDFGYRAFDPSTDIDWVWAHSFTRDEPVLVPERNVFYGPRPDGWPGFCFETSSGCAVGASIEEAAVHGLRELAERDAFLLTWYRRLQLPEVALEDLSDRSLRVLLERCTAFTGARVRAFLATMEYGLPSLWLTAEPAGEHEPCVLAGGAAHFHPAAALRAGLYELTGLVLAARHDHAERREAGQRMLADPDQVRHMRDHALVNSLPAARARFSFLLDSPGPSVPLDDVPSHASAGRSDLRELLRSVVAGFAAAGMDVLVADQSTPEITAAGLHCARVIVPGLVPITFGHINRRTVGLPRLTDGPRGIGHASGLEPGEEVGSVPHPFP